MAKRKKSRASQTSKGERRNVVNGKHRKSDWTPLQTILHKQEAWLQGKKVMLTIPNPNKNETKARFIRVPANQIWGSPKPYMMKATPE